MTPKMESIIKSLWQWIEWWSKKSSLIDSKSRDCKMIRRRKLESLLKTNVVQSQLNKSRSKQTFLATLRKMRQNYSTLLNKKEREKDSAWWFRAFHLFDHFSFIKFCIQDLQAHWCISSGLIHLQFTMA